MSRPAAVLAVLLSAVALPATACSQAPAVPRARPAPALSAQVVQLRRDEVLQRVQVAITNAAAVPVRIQTVELLVGGYTGSGAQPADEPLPPGQVVNLPTPYGEVSCPTTGPVEVGEPLVVVQVRRETDDTSYTVRLRPSDPRGVLRSIAQTSCRLRALASQVSLSFGPWRQERGKAGTVLVGTLVARLLGETAYTLTQLAGSVVFDLLPVGPVRDPLARLTPDRRTVRLPVRLRAARCDAHTRGEIKKPYAFLVWVGRPGTTPYAVNPQVSDRDAAAFEAVCTLGWAPAAGR